MTDPRPSGDLTSGAGQTAFSGQNVLHHPTLPSQVVEASLLAATTTAAFALSGLVAGGIGGPSTWPFLLAASMSFTIAALLLRRTHVFEPLVAAAGVLSALLAAVWTTALGTTFIGLPTQRTAQFVIRALRDSHNALTAGHLPLPATPGVLFLGALLAGLAGTAARLLLGSKIHSRSQARATLPAAALLPGLLIVTASFSATSNLTSIIVAAIFGAFALATVVRHGRWRSVLHLASAAMAVALATGLASQWSIAAGSTPAARAQGSHFQPTALALMTNVATVQNHDPNTVMFRTRSPIPTYWQVGVLTRYVNGRWLPDSAVSRFLARGVVPSPVSASSMIATSLRAAHTHASAPASPTASRRFLATVNIGRLASRLLPVPPEALRIRSPHSPPPGAKSPGVISSSVIVAGAGAVAPSATTPGERYRVVAAVPAASPLPGTLPRNIPAALTRTYLALAHIPSKVRDLAMQIGAYAPSPLAKAEALVDWFRSNGFKYTTDPPASPRNMNPLLAFLTVTHSGNCQSFASAFTVMARELGLPTRIAVGFTEGQPQRVPHHSPSGTGTGTGSRNPTGSEPATMVVRGIDAHSWPEVYLGQPDGWVSFEPTPGLPGGNVIPPGVIGPTRIATLPLRTSISSTPKPPPSIQRTRSTTTPSTVVRSTTTSTLSASRPGKSTTASSRLQVPHNHTVKAWIWPIVIFICVLTLGAALWLAMRRVFIQRRRRHSTLHKRVTTAMRNAERALQSSGIDRPAWISPPAHARKLSTLPQLSKQRQVDAVRDFTILCELWERSSFCPGPVSDSDAVEAERRSRRVCHAFRKNSAFLSRRARRILSSLRLPRTASRSRRQYV